MLLKLQHIAVICKNYEISKQFYKDVLGLEVTFETYRKERNSYKADLYLNGQYIIELFSFPEPPQRLTFPEATGLRHLAFEVNDFNFMIEKLKRLNITYEPIRIDEFTQKQFTFIFDPDKLPIELYEK